MPSMTPAAIKASGAWALLNTLASSQTHRYDLCRRQFLRISCQSRPRHDRRRQVPGGVADLWVDGPLRSPGHRHRRRTGMGPATPINNMEDPWGLTLIGNYAMVKARHMFQYGTTPEQFAAISVVTRRHAMRNPEAVKAMTDLEFVGVREITVQDVLESRMIAYPMRLLECCMVSDGGGAVVIASPEVVRNTRKKPVWIIGCGEATKYRENNGDITVSAGAQAAPIAFGEAGVTPAEIDVLMAYDSFTITVMCLIEDLGFCKKGEGGAYVGRRSSGLRRSA